MLARHLIDDDGVENKMPTVLRRRLTLRMVMSMLLRTRRKRGRGMGRGGGGGELTLIEVVRSYFWSLVLLAALVSVDTHFRDSIK